MPVNKTPSPFLAGATALPEDNVQFKPPSGKLAAVTSKGNEITELMNSSTHNQELLKTHYEAYLEKIEALRQACFDQTGLSGIEEIKRTEWWSTNYSSIIGLRVSYEKYIKNITGAYPKIPQSKKSLKSNASFIGSACSNTSSAIVRLAENKAKLIAEKERNSKMFELRREELQRKQQIEQEKLTRKAMNEEEELEYQRKVKIIENNALETETMVLEAELLKLADLADKVERASLKSVHDLAHKDLQFSAPAAGFVRDNRNPTLLEVLQNQTVITEKIAKHQEKAELPKKVIPIFSGENITDYRSFIQNFKRTIDSKCDNYADCLYYLEQYTAGLAKELVKSCSQHDASKAYKQALKLLDEEFGNEHKTATAYLEKLDSWPTIKSEDSDGIKKLAIYLMTCSNNMESMTCVNQLNSPKEIMGVVQKLPFELRRKWRNKTLELMENGSQVTFLDLVKFVRLQSKILNQPLFGNITEPSKNPVIVGKITLTTRSSSNEDFEKSTEYSNENFTTIDENGSSTTNIQNTAENSSLETVKAVCPYCKKSNHCLKNCFFYQKLDYDKKMAFLKKWIICFACLEHGHNSKGCMQKLTCEKCNMKHPTVLHNESYSWSGRNDHDSNYAGGEEYSSQSEGNRICSTKASPQSATGAGESKRQKILCCIVPIQLKIKGQNETVKTYAALDTCSDSSFIDSSLLPQLQIPQRDEKLKINVVGGSNSEISTTAVKNVELYHMNGKLQDTVPVVFSQSHWPFKEEDAPQKDDLEREGLHNVPYHFINAGIGIIIGMNRPALLKPLEIIESENNLLYASRHLLGWAMNGIAQETITKAVSVNRIKVPDIADIEAKAAAKKIIGVNDLQYSVDTLESCAKLFTDNTDADSKGGFRVTNYITNLVQLYNMMTFDILEPINIIKIFWLILILLLLASCGICNAIPRVSRPIQSQAPAKVNPNGCISRGIAIEKIIKNEIWKNCPKLMWKKEDSWTERFSWKIEDKLKRKTKNNRNGGKMFDCILERSTIQSSCSRWFNFKRRVTWIILKGIIKMNILSSIEYRRRVQEMNSGNKYVISN